MKKLLVFFAFVFFYSLDGLVYSQFLTESRVCIAGKNSGKITTEEVLKHKQIGIVNNGSGKYSVVAYRLTLIYFDRDLEEYFSNTDSLTENMIAAIKKAEKGCKLYVEFIKVKNNENDSLLSIPPMSFTFN
jgi:hypothetical protein